MIDYEAEGQTFFVGAQKNNIVWLFSTNGFRVVSFNLDTLQCEKYEVDVELKELMDCYIEEDKVYLSMRNGCVYVWDLNTFKLSLIRKSKEDEQVGTIVVTEKNIILFPAMGKDIILIDRNNHQRTTYSDYPKGFRYQINERKYRGYCENMNYIFLAMRSANHILQIDKKTGKLTWKKPVIPDDYELKKETLKMWKRQLTETQLSGKDFIQLIYEKEKEEMSLEEIRIGEKIWNAVN